MRLSAGKVILLFLALLNVVTCLFSRDAMVGVVAISAFIGIPTLLIMGAGARAHNGTTKPRRRSRGFDEEEWRRNNRHENDLGEY